MMPLWVFSQSAMDQKISLSHERVKLKRVLKTIEKKSGINFSYSKKLIPVDERINL
jgi:peptide subunit release factor 1 (eRF1)